MSNGLQKAIDYFDGSLTKLGQELDVSKAVIWAWKDRGQVPAEKCPLIERATNGTVRCEELRPDIQWEVLRHTRRQKAAA